MLCCLSPEDRSHGTHCASRWPRGGFCWHNQLESTRMSTKEILLEMAEKLPPDATLVDAI